ncbi:MAG: TonB-dependent receptor [Candidatus Kapabacteria bacterium]|nr:TonB-dependent receptor [Candidatus Kapabacteria bacterium]MDW8012659.1 TonB-dependent receptor [Bacteroidota bacterium]
MRLSTVGPIVAVSLAATAADTTYVFPPTTVTALRTTQLPLVAPYAQTYRTAEDWDSRRSYGVEEALRRIPGLFVQDRAGTGDLRIVVRGFGARGAGDRSNNGTTRGVRILLDGVPLTEPDGRTALDLLEPTVIAEVDILRSNSTLLWGNASGGVIAFRTIPLLTAPPLTLSASAGSFGFRKVTAQFVSHSATSTISGTVAHSASSGWRRHAQAQRWWAGLSVASELQARTLIELTASFTANRFNIPGPLSWEEFLQDPEAANAVYLEQRARRENLIAHLTVTLSHSPTPSQRLQLSTFVQPKFLTRSERGTYREFSRVMTGGSLLYHPTWHLSPTATLLLTIGGDVALQDGPALFYKLTADGGRDSVLRQNKREAALNAGTFARALFLLGPWQFWLGLRSDWLAYRLIDALRPSLSDYKLFRAILPSGGIGYRLSEHHSVYAHVSSGWEVPAYNEVDPPPTAASRGINPDLKPMRSWTVEVGSRHMFRPAQQSFLQDIRADFALYWIDSRNEIVPYGGGRFYVNAARSQRMGVEVQVTLGLRGGLTLQAVATLASMRYRSYVVDSSYFGIQRQVDFSNNRIAGVPAVQGGFHAEYTLPWLPIRLGVELSYVGPMYADDANEVRVPDYALWNVSIRSERSWSIAGIAVSPWAELRNLANRRYVGSVYVNPDRDSRGRPLFAELGMPRAITVGLQVNTAR